MPIISPLPNTFVNGTTIDATQVDANFAQILSNVNTNAAENGANSSITSLSGLTTPLSVPQGGTGAATLTAGAPVLANGTSPFTVGAVGALVPTGAVFPYVSTSAPTGYLACNGQAVSRATYAALFAIIGTAYGVGDGSTTFNVPDGRGRTFAGYDSGNATGRLTKAQSQGVDASALGNSGGEQGHSLTSGENGTHNHPFSYVNGAVQSGGIALNGVSGGLTDNTAVQNSGSGTAHNTVQPTLIAMWIIKT